MQKTSFPLKGVGIEFAVCFANDNGMKKIPILSSMLKCLSCFEKNTDELKCSSFSRSFTSSKRNFLGEFCLLLEP